MVCYCFMCLCSGMVVVVVMVLVMLFRLCGLISSVCFSLLVVLVSSDSISMLGFFGFCEVMYFLVIRFMLLCSGVIRFMVVVW